MQGMTTMASNLPFQTVPWWAKHVTKSSSLKGHPKIIGKKTTYALKTPHVVALPFIYGVEYIKL